MFQHGWLSYLENAFPDDELRPLTCAGLERDLNDPANTARNDALGSYALTLVDSLTTFVVLGDRAGFHTQVERVRRYVQFDVPSTVQVFETTIRALGSLLSAHTLASTPRLGFALNGYDGFLLELAHDLGTRLLPAFDSHNGGIPAPRVNLRSGRVNCKVTPPGKPDVTETCTSGAGSLLLEFGLLSRLTGDPRFEANARRAFFELYAKRTDLDLMPMSIDSQTGEWLTPLISGIGANLDSFYEYALKYGILFNDDTFIAMFERLYRGLKAHSFDGWAFHNVNSKSAILANHWIDSVGAFFPSVMVIAGDLEDAARAHLVYYNIWTTFGALPERFNLLNRGSSINATVELEWYPLRPEFIESTFHLYQATKDPFYLHVGERVMRDLQNRSRVKCGYAGIKNVLTGELEDRMESFFLSETVKYLYLLFDVDNPMNRPSKPSNQVFSTEAHMLWYDEDIANHAGYHNFERLLYMGEYDDQIRYTGLSISSQVDAEPDLDSVNAYQDDLGNPELLVTHLLTVQTQHEHGVARDMAEYISRDPQKYSEPPRRTYQYASQCDVSFPLGQNLPKFRQTEEDESNPNTKQSCSCSSRDQKIQQETLNGVDNGFGMYSLMGSWNRLYEINSLYEFTRNLSLVVAGAAGDGSGESLPRAAIGGGATTKFFTNFILRYIDPKSTCSVPLTVHDQDASQAAFELIVAKPHNAVRGRVLYRSLAAVQCNDKNAVSMVIASSLYGLRVRFAPYACHAGSAADGGGNNERAADPLDFKYRVEIVDGHVLGNNHELWVHTLSSISRSNGDKVLEVVETPGNELNRVRVNGKLVTNLKVLRSGD